MPQRALNLEALNPAQLEELITAAAQMRYYGLQGDREAADAWRRLDAALQAIGLPWKGKSPAEEARFQTVEVHYWYDRGARRFSYDDKPKPERLSPIWNGLQTMRVPLSSLKVDKRTGRRYYPNEEGGDLYLEDE